MTSPEVEGNRVRFRFRAADASMVSCVGTFNHWDVERGVMRKSDDGVWTLDTVVPFAGSYDYKFVADGRWMTDPENPDYGRDHAGRINSRFSVHVSDAGEELLRNAAADLEKSPPSEGVTPLRRDALARIDDLFSLPTASYALPVRDLFRDRLAALAETDADGIYHLYNHGFLFARNGFGLGIDLVSTRTVWSLYWDVPLQLVESLARRVQCLVVSHSHPDHYDHLLARLVLDRGGRVLVPSEVAGRFAKGATGVRADETVEAGPWKVRMPAGRHVYDDLGGLVVRLVELETEGGLRILHTTDHDYTRGVPARTKPSLLIPKSGGVSPALEDRLALRQLIRHLEPGYVLPGHIRELGHPVNGGREPYATALEAISALEVPWTILFWGERLPWEAIPSL